MNIALCVSGGTLRPDDKILDELRAHTVVVFSTKETDKFKASRDLGFQVQKQQHRGNVRFDLCIKYELRTIELSHGWLVVPRRSDEVFTLALDEGDITVTDNLGMRRMSFDFFYCHPNAFFNLMNMVDFNYEHSMKVFSRYLRDEIRGDAYHFHFHVKRLGYHCVVNDKVMNKNG